MDRIKRLHFERLHPGMPFPDCYDLTQDESETLRRELSLRLNIPSWSDGLTILRSLLEMGIPFDAVNALDDSFSLRDVMTALRICPMEKVYVNWHRFDIVDRLAYDDLIKYFSDIWYPSSDDIEILDTSLSWIVMIAHDGLIRHVTLPVPPTGSAH